MNIRDDLEYKSGFMQSIKDGAKICKYEFSMSRILLIITAVVSIFITLLNIMRNGNISGVVEFTLGVLIFFSFLIFSVCYLLSVAISFYQGIFGRTAYLTHSLPISFNAILLGKTFVFLLWALVFLMELVYLDLATGARVTLDLIWDYDNIGLASATGIYCYIVTFWLIWLLAEIMYIFMIATLVHKKKTYVFAWGIMYYFGIKIALCIVFVIITISLPYSFYEWLSEPDNIFVNQWIITELPPAIMAVVFYFICMKIIRDRLSI